MRCTSGRVLHSSHYRICTWICSQTQSCGIFRSFCFRKREGPHTPFCRRGHSHHRRDRSRGCRSTPSQIRCIVSRTSRTSRTRTPRCSDTIRIHSVCSCISHPTSPRGWYTCRTADRTCLERLPAQCHWVHNPRLCIASHRIACFCSPSDRRI